MTSAEAAKQSDIRELRELVAGCRRRASLAVDDWERAKENYEADRLDRIISQKQAGPFLTDNPPASGWGPENYRGWRRILFGILGV